MRKYKQLCSMAVTGALLVSTMSLCAGAVDLRFTDSDQIVNLEAVEAMVDLGVINGRVTGEFDPTGIVTRGEMAKMIALALTGGTDPTYEDGRADFTDTADHWAEPYIIYCTTLSILDGYGDGTFAPDDQVTGTEAAKMFLCALGYDSATEGLVGDDWAGGTDNLASLAGLYDGLDASQSSGGMSRDSAAQLVYNGVQGQEVTYNDAGDVVELGTMLENRFATAEEEVEEEVEEEATLETAYATSGNWMYIYEQAGYSSAGDIVNAITDNGVMEDILIDDAGDEMVVGAAYRYQWTGEGYELDRLYTGRDEISFGTISVKGTSSFVLDTSSELLEYSYGSETAFVFVDENHTVTWDVDFAEGDFVLAVLDGDDDMLAIILLDEASDAQAEVLAYNTAVLTRMDDYNYTIRGDDLTVAAVIDSFMIPAGASLTISDANGVLGYSEVLNSPEGYTFVVVAPDGTTSPTYSLTITAYS